MKKKISVKGLLKIDDQFLYWMWIKKLYLKLLPNLTSPQQTAYLESRFIGESGRLIADIINITGTLNKEGFLVTMDIEKTFIH